MELLYPSLALVLGLIGIIFSSDKFVEGSVGIAESLNIPKVIIGLTIVAFGTSAPELLVSIVSALEGTPKLAYGNAVGSNITNICLVLGVTLLFYTLNVKEGFIKQDIPINLMVVILVYFLLSDQHIGQLDGYILAGSLVLLTFLMIMFKKEHEEEFIDTEEYPSDINLGKACLEFILGLTVLIACSKALVWGATGIATHFGISELIIGLTIVAIGTSLPELAAALTSAKKGHHDIALASVFGSNIMNLLLVLAGAAIIEPISLEMVEIKRDYGFLAFATLALVAFSILPNKQSKLGKSAGIFFFTAYWVYMYILYMAVTG